MGDILENLDRHHRLKELAQLSPIDYEKARPKAAEELGCKLTTLDAELRQFKAAQAPENDLGAVPVEEVEPYDYPVDGRVAYSVVKETIERYMDLPRGAATTVALWIFGTYTYDQFALFPKLLISSPEKECGKSTLMEIIEALVWRAYLTSSGTEASIFRLIDVYHPALLLDETDRWVTRDKPGLIAAINCGHTRRGAKVLRTVGDDHMPKNFSVWGPMALAGIKKPDDTIVSRSVQVELKRMPPGTRKEKIPIDLFDQNRELRRMLLRWAQDEAELHHEPIEAPEGGGSRERDNWSVLLKIASRLGVFDEAVAAFYGAVSENAEDEPTIGTRLLADIRDLFGDRDRIWSAELVRRLVDLEDRPWADWKGGFTQNKLARQLQHYKIRSKPVRIGTEVQKGYKFEQFVEEWERYLPSVPPLQTGTTLHTSNGGALRHSETGTPADPVTLSDCPISNGDEGCNGVSVQTPPTEGRPEYRPFSEPEDF